MKTAIVLIISIFTACYLYITDTTTEPAFYEKQFRIEAKKRGIKLQPYKIRFVFIDMKNKPDGSGTVGVCGFIPVLGTKTIWISKPRWSEESTNFKQLLVYHELAHCLMGMEHRENTLSIMNAYLLNPYTYGMDKSYFVNELFNPAK